MSRVILALAVVGLLCLEAAPASSTDRGGRENLRLSADITRFRGSDDESVLIEIAYSLPESGLSYRPDSAGFTGTADVSLIVIKGDSSVFADRWLVPHSVLDTVASSQTMNLVGVYKLQLGEGEYQFKFITRDRNDPLRRDSLSMRVPVRKVALGKPLLSDLSLASTIRQGTKGSIFYKNTLDVVPNVGGMYSEDAKCFYYAEAYNLFSIADTGDFLIRTAVYDAVGKEIISRERPRKRVAESSVIVDQFPVKSLRTGTYGLLLTLLDQRKTNLATSGRKFFVYNPTLGVDSTLMTSARGVPMAEYMAMDESELDREFRWSRYATTEAESRAV